MADNSAFTPFSNIASGFESGLKVAQMAEKLEQDKIAAKQRSESHEAQKFTWFSNQLGSALAADPTVRKVQLKRLQAQAPAIGIPWDPGNNDLLMNDEYARHAQQGLIQLNGLPDNQKSQAASSIFAMTGDVGALSTGLSQLGQRYTQNAMMQAAAQAKPAIAPLDLAKFESEESQRFNQQTQKNQEVVIDANRIESLLSSPDRNLDIMLANKLMAHMSDPSTGVRESELNDQERAALQGLPERIAAAAKSGLGFVRLDETQRAALMSAAAKLAGEHANRIERVKAGFAGRATPLGASIERIAAGAPTLSKRMTASLSGNAPEPSTYVNSASKSTFEKLSPGAKAQFAKAHPAAYAAFSGATPPETNRQVAGVAAPKGKE